MIPRRTGLVPAISLRWRRHRRPRSRDRWVSAMVVARCSDEAMVGLRGCGDDERRRGYIRCLETAHSREY